MVAMVTVPFITQVFFDPVIMSHLLSVTDQGGKQVNNDPASRSGNITKQ